MLRNEHLYHHHPALRCALCWTFPSCIPTLCMQLQEKKQPAAGKSEGSNNDMMSPRPHGSCFGLGD